jgi:phosphomevalonate kinase
MILDKSNGRFDEIKTFTKKDNILERFNETFSRLESYSVKGYKVTLYSDFALHSMEFSITDNDKTIFYGGFIYNVAYDGYGNGGAPTFSVCTDPDNKSGWSIRT